MLVNSSQAIEGEGEIRIRTWEEGETVRIAISDSGKGIPPELQSKVFEPGFTTKKAGLGTGLGLSICLRIVQDHGGRIELESEVGRGTTFTIVLPIQEAAERKANG
jgi:two-component system NtrC family sensor kinase